MTTEEFQNFAQGLPLLPGVYKFIHPKGEILYVGKAKNLLHRLTSYFGERHDREVKTKIMVKLAQRIEFTIVNTEQDALLLECAMIKEHQPRFNVLLKDGKNYPYICITRERFPKVILTRRVLKDSATYYGPYTSFGQVSTIFDMIRRVFPLRTCALDLSEKNILAGKFKVCLEYHIKNCNGPCVGYEAEDVYNVRVAQVRNILSGKVGLVRQHLKEQMGVAADALNFEYAQRCKERLHLLDDYQSRSPIISATLGNLDVFHLAQHEQFVCISYMQVRDGVVVYTFNLDWTCNIEDEATELLALAIVVLQEQFRSVAPEVVVPFEVVVGDANVKVTIPKKGEKFNLLELAERNAKYQLLQRRKQAASQTVRQNPSERVLRTLQADLNMKELPIHIECFDNSNIGGTYPVSACVVFKNAKPAKADYRHYNVKTVVGPNDFATMEEVVYRRYKRLLDENSTLPQLVIIDGGKGQLSSAMKSLDLLGLRGKMTVVGIAKQLEEIFFPDDPLPLYIDKKSESLKVIQHARNEAHRFGITFHRNQRSKNFTQTELTDIPGIGQKTAEKLLVSFGSVARMRELAVVELAQQVGLVAATNVYNYFHKPEPNAPQLDAEN